MSSSLSWKEWLLIVIINVLVSALTTWIVVRVLTNQPAPALPEAVKAVAPVAAAAPGSALVVASQPTLAAPTLLPPTKPTAASVTSLSVATTGPTTVPTLAPPTEAPTRQATGVRIASVTFPGQRQREFVALVNEGDTSSLQGWVLQSARGISYTLPNVTVFKDGFLNIYSTAGTNSATELFIGRNDAAWQAGDVLSLLKEGQTISRFEVK